MLQQQSLREVQPEIFTQDALGSEQSGKFVSCHSAEEAGTKSKKVGFAFVIMLLMISSTSVRMYLSLVDWQDTDNSQSTN